MVSKLFLSSAALALVAAPLVRGQGGYVEVQNACTFDIYEYGVYSGGNPISNSAAPGQGTEWYYPRDGQSFSIKFGPTSAIASGPSDPDGPNGPFQVEVAYNSTAGLVYYDFSTLDGNPFNAYQRTITPNDSSCQVISCPPNQNDPACSPGSYYPGEPSTYNPVYACSLQAILTVQFC